MQASNTQYRVTLGKSLKDMEERLTSYGVKEGCKLMMIGKRVRVMFLDVTWHSNSACYLWLSPIKQNSPEEEAELKKLKDIEKSVEQTAKKLEKVGGELTGLKNVRFCCFKNSSVPNALVFVHGSNSPALNTQGFLAKDLQIEALGKLDHRVKTAAEQLMKTLERIDALVIHFFMCTFIVCFFFLNVT